MEKGGDSMGFLQLRVKKGGVWKKLYGGYIQFLEENTVEKREMGLAVVEVVY